MSRVVCRAMYLDSAGGRLVSGIGEERLVGLRVGVKQLLAGNKEKHGMSGVDVAVVGSLLFFFYRI